MDIDNGTGTCREPDRAGKGFERIGRFFFRREDAIAMFFGVVLRDLSIALAIDMTAFGKQGTTIAPLPALAGAGVAMVDFNATRCGPCRMMEPVLDELEAAYAGTAAVVRGDVDENRELAGRLNIQSIPTIILFKDGAQVRRLIGLVERRRIEDGARPGSVRRALRKRTMKGLFMGRCINHPERETNYLCMKHNISMCEECLRCRDPKLYCKHRQACPIWFLTRHGDALGDDSREEAPSTGGAERHEIVFTPDEKRITVTAGTTLLDAGRKAGVHLNASCHGKGSCDICRLIVSSGPVDAPSTALLNESERAGGYVPACQSTPTGDVTLRIPEETPARRCKVSGTGREAAERLRGMVMHIEPMLSTWRLYLRNIAGRPHRLAAT